MSLIIKRRPLVLIAMNSLVLKSFTDIYLYFIAEKHIFI